MPKQQATASPAQPMPRNICAVAFGPVAPQHEEEQEGGGEEGAPEHHRPAVRVVMKRAMVPPKLQVTAAPATSSTPQPEIGAAWRW